MELPFNDFTSIKETVRFIRAQGVTDIRKYVTDRAKELHMSLEECVEDLQHSALDLSWDRHDKTLTHLDTAGIHYSQYLNE